jgi:hypothetical protein
MSRLGDLVTPIAKGGYFSRGVVYLIIGFFALLAAVGRGEKKDSEGAIRELFGQPFGETLVLAMVAGLVSYVLWRLIQSIFDTDRHGWSLKGAAIRAALLVSAMSYSALAVYALSLLGFFAGGGGDDEPNPVAGFFAGLVGAKYVALGLAVILGGVAVAHWRKAWTRKYAERFDASENAMLAIHPIAILGLTARGAVFAIISLLLIYRYLSADTSAESSPNISDAMAFVEGLPYGRWLLAILGAGLILFAGYSFIESVWRRINIEDA